MKTKIAFWGTIEIDNTSEKVLVALELNPSTNKVTSCVFEGEMATTEFSKILFEDRQNIFMLSNQVVPSDHCLTK